jgi:hypothetical protein
VPTIVSFNKRIPPDTVGGAGRGTLAELMAKRKTEADALSASMAPQETPTIMQGLGHVAQTISAGIREGRAANEESTSRDELAKIVAGINPDTGATPEQLANIGRYNPELARQYQEEAVQARRDAAARQAAIDDQEDEQRFRAGESEQERKARHEEADASRAVTLSEGKAGRDLTVSENATTRQQQLDIEGKREAADTAKVVLADALASKKPLDERGQLYHDYSQGLLGGPPGSDAAYKALNDGLAKINAPPASTIINNNPDSNKFYGQLDEKLGQDAAETAKQLPVAMSTLGDIAKLRELSKTVSTGPVPGWVASRFGNFESAGQAFQSIIMTMAPKLHQAGTGSQSDIEYGGILQSLPAIQNWPQGNAMILDIMEQKANINRQAAEIANNVALRKIDRATGQAQLEAVYAQHLNIPPELTKFLADDKASNAGAGKWNSDNPNAPAPATGAPDAEEDPADAIIRKKYSTAPVR